MPAAEDDSSPVVEVRGLSRRFGTHQALDDVTLDVRPGLVYGLVGSNGAGKSTLLKHLLGLYRPQRGTVRVFGLDPVLKPVEVLGQIGYLSEDRDLPDWMQVGVLLDYTGAIYPTWDQAYARELLDTFALDPRKKVKTLSKGMRAQAGLIVAVAHRPRLLLLDEPSCGLDAVVRKDILNVIVRTVADDGRTVIFSSHLFDEIELMSDELFMIVRRKLAVQGDVADLRARHVVAETRRRIEPSPLTWPGLISTEPVAGGWRVVCETQAESVEATRGVFESAGIAVTSLRGASLQEVFVARAGRRTGTASDRAST